MRIVTYNMRQGGSAAHWEAVLTELRPDLLFAQETNDPACLSTLFFSIPSARVHWAAAHERRWGSALMLPAVGFRPLEIPGYRGWVAGAEVENVPWAEGSRLLRLFSVHVPSGRGSYVREANRILDAILSIPGPADFVIGGDFNLTVSRGRTGLRRALSRGESDLLTRLGRDCGVMSAWEAANPGLPLAQTLRWAKDPATPYHCDGVFLPVSWASRLTRASVIADGPWIDRSDHNPVVLELGLT